MSTVDLLAYLAGKFESTRLLIVVTYRSSELLLAKHPFLPVKLDLQARGVCREIPLPFLDRGEVETYLTLEFPDHRFPTAFATLVHSKTEGSPLFMVDLLRYLRGGQVIAREEDHWALVTSVPDLARELPESVRGMIQRKIDLLTDANRRLLTVGSVQGYEFDAAVIAQAMAVDAGEVEEQLDELERVHAFIRLEGEKEFPDHTVTRRYRFVHVLYQNALYASVGPARKASWSRAVAEALVSHYGEQTREVANELAVLFEAARDFGRATHYFAVAAQNALEISANREAAVLARHGIELLEMLPSSAERIRQELALQLILALALRNVMGFGADEVGQVYRRARELSQSTGEGVKLFPVLRGMWEFYELRAEYKTALELADQCLSLASDSGDSELLLVAHDISGDTRVWLGQFPAARKHLEQAIALYDPQRDRAHAYNKGSRRGHHPPPPMPAGDAPPPADPRPDVPDPVL